ncbi:MAG TPA: DUF2726 domain-containing protein [Burkholderiaceae bacterium]|nr:DUF2726 domain-containing protein [Burkholderiaceae bacterium]
MPFDPILLLPVLAILLLAGFLYWRKRQGADPAEEAVGSTKRGREELDMVSAWPPEATRLLTGGERATHELLLKSLPECMIFAQVPLARFLKVPRRHSYTEWLTRVGHLCADLVICDRATQVIGVVLLQSVRESERGERRRARMGRVLKAAGVKVFTWREEALPSVEFAREQLTQRLGDINVNVEPVDITSPRPSRAAVVGGGKIPVPEVVAEGAIDDGPRREPPASTWFDDLDSSRPGLDSGMAPLDSDRMSLDPARRQDPPR